MRSHILAFGALVLATAATAVLCPDASAGGDHDWTAEYGNSWFESKNWDPERGGVGLDRLFLDLAWQPDCWLSGSNDTISWLWICNGNVLNHTDCTLQATWVRVGYDNQTGSYYLTGSNAKLISNPDDPWHPLCAYVGVGGPGYFSQAGGLVWVSALYLGGAADIYPEYEEPTYDMTGGELHGSIFCGVSSSGRFKLEGDAATVFAMDMFIGSTADGVFDHLRGDLAIDPDFPGFKVIKLGCAQGVRGTYNLSGGCIREYQFEEHTYCYSVECGAAEGGIGTFNHTGGAATYWEIRVGYFTGSDGQYALSEPTEVASEVKVRSNVYVGDYGQGEFRQDGGSVDIAGDLILGNHSGSVGTYELNGGTLTVTGDVTIKAQGCFKQDGGSVDIAGDLILANDSNSGGTYELNGGTLTVTGDVTIKARGKIKLASGSTLVIQGKLIVDGGEFEYGGGTLNVAGTVEVNGDGALKDSAPNTPHTLSVGTGGITSTSEVENTSSTIQPTIAFTGNAAITVTGATHTLNTGALNAGAFTLTKAGEGTLAAGAVTAGTLQHDAGTLIAGAVQANVFNVNASATIASLTGTGTAPSALVAAGQQLQVGTFSNLSSVTVDGTMIAGAGASSATSMSVAAGGQLELDGTTLSTTNPISVAGTILAAGGATSTISNGADFINGSRVTTNDPLIVSAPSIAAGATLIKDGTSSLTFSGTQSHGAGAVLQVGGGVVNLNTNAGTLSPGPGTPTVANLLLRITGGDSKVVLGSDQALAGLDVQNATGGLQKLDLNDYAVRVFPANTATLEQAVRTMISAGITTGDGIYDSTAAADERVGYTDQRWDLDGAQYVAVRTVYGGDANMDGSVNGADLALLATNYGVVSGMTWDLGDFNYDGQIDGADLAILATNYDKTGGNHVS